MKQQVKVSQIDSVLLVCPYCMDEVSGNETGCCSESSAHFEKAYVIQDETVLASEIELINDTN